jgi:hypothetical protein
MGWDKGLKRSPAGSLDAVVRFRVPASVVSSQLRGSQHDLSSEHSVPVKATLCVR